MFGLTARSIASFACVSSVAASLALASGCSGSQTAPSQTPASSSSVEVHKSGASVQSLQIAPESLQVDKVGGRDSFLYPDGLRDLVFITDVTGPISALFLLSTDDRGEPNGFFRTNTMVSNEEAPKEFGGTLELGRMTTGIGVYEEGKAINRANGSILLAPGPHHLTLYTSNPGTLQSGRHVRLFAVLADKAVVKGPILAIP